MKNIMLVCRKPTRNFWQLGKLSTADENLVLVGWQVSPKPVDGGLPKVVGEILAQTMSFFGNVIFLSSDAQADEINQWKFSGDEAVRVLREPNPLKRFAAVLSGGTEDLKLLSSRNPQTVESLFDDGLYPWWMQGQIIFLSDPERVLPEIDRPTLLSLFEDEWLKQAERLKDLHIKCLLRPGVDGSVAGFLFLTDDFRDNFLKLLEEKSRAAEFEWRSLSESDFTAALAT